MGKRGPGGAVRAHTVVAAFLGRAQPTPQLTAPDGPARRPRRGCAAVRGEAVGRLDWLGLGGWVGGAGGALGWHEREQRVPRCPTRSSTPPTTLPLCTMSASHLKPPPRRPSPARRRAPHTLRACAPPVRRHGRHLARRLGQRGGRKCVTGVAEWIGAGGGLAPVRCAHGVDARRHFRPNLPPNLAFRTRAACCTPSTAWATWTPPSPSTKPRLA